MQTIAKLITNGFALVPIPAGQKNPTKRGWNKPESVVTDIINCNLLTAMNIGIAHAYCKPTPTCAVDIDNYPQAVTWFSNKSIDLRRLLTADDAVVIHSGKRHSLKLLYRLPAGLSPLPSKVVSDIAGKVIFEFRCATATGLTVQDILPPSVHPSGNKYEWVGKGSVEAMPEIPVALLCLWQELIAATEKPPHAQKPKLLTPETSRQKARIHTMLNHVSADCSYDTYRAVVWSLLSLGWSCGPDIAYEWSITTPNRFNRTCFDALINSYDPLRTDSPTLGTLIHLAKSGGYHG